MVWQLRSSASAAVRLSKRVLRRQPMVAAATTVNGTAATAARLTAVRSFAAPAPAPKAAAPPVATSAAAQEPKQYSVKDRIVHLTIVDPSGARKQITGLVGKTLYQALAMQGLDIGPSSGGGAPEIARTERWIEPTFGEGPTSGYDHVVLAGKGADTVTRMTPVEEQQLQDFWDFDEVFSGSRLASTVTLTKAMDGMVVYVPDRLADDVP